MTEKLQSIGINTVEALERFMNDEDFYLKMLKKFEKTVEDTPVLEYFESGETEKALKNAHTLKGVTGNFSMTALYEGYAEVVDLLRKEQIHDARKTFDSILPLQKETIELINTL